MKLFSQVSVKKIFLLALVIRFLLIPLSFHSDLNNNEIWGIYAGEFGLRGFYDWLNFGNYARPDYPPLAKVILLALRFVWQFIFNILWEINVAIPLFPSDLVTWFDEFGFIALIKLPGIFADMALGFLIFKFAKGKTKQPIIYASYFLLNPAIIYLSSSWGQFDSTVTLFALLTIVSLPNHKYFQALTYYFISIMTKATFVPITPILLIQSIKQRISLKTSLLLIFLVILYSYILGFFFIDKNPAIWLFNLYTRKIIQGAVTLPYINLNAFNFWGIVLGLERVEDNLQILRLSLKTWAYLISLPFLLLILRKFTKGAELIHTVIILYFTIFMFFPRVHERYLYPAIALFPLLLVQKPKLKKIYLVASFIFFLNLYHWWWFPNIPPLVFLLDLELVERLLSFANLTIFFLLFHRYLSTKIEK